MKGSIFLVLGSSSFEAKRKFFKNSLDRHFLSGLLLLWSMSKNALCCIGFFNEAFSGTRNFLRVAGMIGWMF